MRTSRKQQLPQTGGLVHKFWRAHNKVYLLEAHAAKESYLKNIFYALNHRSVGGRVAVHSFCVMSNHVHECVSYEAKSSDLSSHMRIAHGKFGANFNRQHNRQGAVAYDRPKTPLIQPDDWHKMQVHFYIEANPLRANMIKDLKLYPYSSFRFYAWGIEDEFTVQLTIPGWYTRLGRTAKQRQAKYRSLFDLYLKRYPIRAAKFTQAYFIGDPDWAFLKTQLLRARVLKVKDPPMGLAPT